MNIIAVDDERHALWLMERAIESVTGKAPTCFLDARAALDHVREHPVDVAFLDIAMDGLDGLHLAKHIKGIRPSANVIFVTGYNSYTCDAFQLHASGYVMKPIDPEQVREELNNLRYPVAPQTQGVRVQCFGNFEVFVDGALLDFGRPKAKEALAYLVDRKGAEVTKRELAGILWEDKDYSHSVQSHLSVLIHDVERTLRDAGVSSILIHRRGRFAVDTAKFACDYYAYAQGDVAAINSYHGEYMANYSWAELTAGFLSGKIS